MKTKSAEKLESDEPKNKQHYIAPVLNHKIILSSWSNQHSPVSPIYTADRQRKSEAMTSE